MNVIKDLYYIKENLVNSTLSHINDLEQIDTEELGAVIDMIKDLEEATYYCTVVEAMENKNNNFSYDEDKMYYPYPIEMRDVREGRSPMSRRSYMESKELHKNSNLQMHELENYMQELSRDITEMIQEATPEEKTMLQQKLNQLAAKIK